MLKKYFKGKPKIRPVHILAILFLIYIFYVGLAGIPQFLLHTKAAMQSKTDAGSYIRQTNDFYSGMLETSQDYKLLQNKGTYINFNGLMANILRQPEMNERVTLTNGHLSIPISKSPAPEEILHAAGPIINFHNIHTASGGKFLFVLVPSQISKFEDLLPAGYTDTTNATADSFLALLEEAGVPCLDLREELQKDGISITDAYYVTDHHWKPETGFWAFGKMVEKLEQLSAIKPLDPFYTDPDNYIFETYENSFLGSAGKRTGIYFAGTDASTLIRPDFDTDISVRIPKRGSDLRGRYEDVAYNTDVILDFSNPSYFEDNVYGLYGWSDMPITHWRNEHAPEQSKFLLIGESFGNIPFSLMSICFGSCDEIDPRHFEEDFTAYYNAYQPDTVIVELNIFAIPSDFTSYTYLD